MAIVREIRNDGQKIFLTFDDGPEPGATEKVLDVLRQHQIPATFFLIAEKAKASPQILRRIQNEGHAIGNHSLDHRYSRYFGGKPAMREWVLSAEEMFRQIGVPETVGFRPPAGVCTPPLVRALDEMQMPLVLWNQRFFDTTFPWTRKKAFQSLKHMRSGGVVLLHDRQPARRIGPFCEVLGEWIEAAKRKGLHFAPLTREICVYNMNLRRSS